MRTYCPRDVASAKFCLIHETVTKRDITGNDRFVDDQRRKRHDYFLNSLLIDEQAFDSHSAVAHV